MATECTKIHVQETLNEKKYEALYEFVCHPLKEFDIVYLALSGLCQALNDYSGK